MLLRDREAVNDEILARLLQLVNRLSLDALAKTDVDHTQVFGVGRIAYHILQPLLFYHFVVRYLEK